ncbi:ribosomal protein L1/ribosomal biogenesis protein [Gorgonomyces haynaldii]|nr:ribosomal protein L1/ribosomal biogenesis protein [Gorgonomyces haynaldii]
MSVDRNQVEKASRALLKWHEKQNKSEELLDNQPTVWLVFTTKKIHDKLKLKPVRIRIPHPFKENPSVCLFTKDPQREFKDKLAEIGMEAKVIGISKLRTKHKTFEQKRLLCQTYDIFLADERILPMLPPMLGKTFFAKKKHPAPVDLTVEDLKKELESAVNATYLHHTQGACTSIRAGTVAQDPVSLADNIMEIVEQAAKKIPGKWNNIQSINVKTNNSAALPIYTSVVDQEDDEEDAE